MRLPDYALSPLTYALLLILFLVLTWRRLPCALRVIGIVVEIALLLLVAPAGANLLVLGVESQVPPPQACAVPTPSTVVVLSSGTLRWPRSPDDFAALTPTSLYRLFAGIALWQRTPDSRLVIAGGGRGVPESVLLANLAVRMGVPRSAMTIDDKSHTTWENALYVSKLSPALPKRIWLVSSALHLPRALGAFRAWGFEPCAWSSESLYQSPRLSLGYFMPQSSSLDKADKAIHELVGEVVYAALEWKRHREATHGAVRADDAPRGEDRPVNAAAAR